MTDVSRYIAKFEEIPEAKGMGTSFRGSVRDMLVSLIYISRKYSDTCVLLGTALKSLRGADRTRDVGKALRWKDVSVLWYKGQLRLPHGSAAAFKKAAGTCKHRYLLAPLIIASEPSPDFSPGLHANALIFDRDGTTVEWFESYGRTPTGFGNDSGALTNALRRLTTKMYGSSAKFVMPTTGSADGIQLRQENERYLKNANMPVGYCVAWSTLYLDVRCACPLIPPDDVPRAIIELINARRGSLTAYINDYSLHLLVIIDELKASGDDLTYETVSTLVKQSSHGNSRFI